MPEMVVNVQAHLDRGGSSLSEVPEECQIAAADPSLMHVVAPLVLLLEHIGSAAGCTVEAVVAASCSSADHTRQFVLDKVAVHLGGSACTCCCMDSVAHADSGQQHTDSFACWHMRRSELLVLAVPQPPVVAPVVFVCSCPRIAAVLARLVPVICSNLTLGSSAAQMDQ